MINEEAIIMNPKHKFDKASAAAEKAVAGQVMTEEEILAQDQKNKADGTAAEAGASGAAAGQAEQTALELAQTKDQLLRLSADFDNFRKRTQKDKEDWSHYAVQNLLEKFLPILDGLDNAIAAVGSAGPETQKVLDGFLMIHKQFSDILQQEGLKEIQALNQPFDPNFHEAVIHAAPEEGQADNQVVMVLRKGYTYRERLIRPSMVKVTKEQ
ncbi:MAG TPA: nucleotide exchange factor GrpE [Peptococcaceae bacterium]|nr:nucleotide exchange factor GrpE [Peptococcaceae bacterium]